MNPREAVRLNPHVHFADGRFLHPAGQFETVDPFLPQRKARDVNKDVFAPTLHAEVLHFIGRLPLTMWRRDEQRQVEIVEGISVWEMQRDGKTMDAAGSVRTVRRLDPEQAQAVEGTEVANRKSLPNPSWSSS